MDNELKQIIEKGGRKVYCILRHTSKSGMMRVIDFFALVPRTKAEGQGVGVFYLSGMIAKELGYPRSAKHSGLIVRGAGMDMGFHVVYSLGRKLFPEGDGRTVTGRNGDKAAETDGGYLLKHEWL